MSHAGAPADGPGVRRVLMVTARYFPDAGGIQTHVREVGERLAEAGVPVDVLATDRSGSLPRTEQVGRLRVARVPAWPRGRDYYFAPEVWRFIGRRRWGLIHCQGVHTFVAPLAMAAALHGGIPYVVTFHTGGHSTSVRQLLRAAQWRVLRPFLTRACKLIAVSRFERELFEAAVRPRPGQLVTIPNGVTLRAATEHRPSQPTILSIGRLERYKGHHRLIAAMPYLIGQIPDVRAVVLGSGSYERQLRRLAADLGVAHRVDIQAVPAGDNAAMMARIQEAALVVLLSDYEAHPVSLLEAASVGRPVLVARTSGLAELVDAGLASGVDAKATPQHTAAAISAALRRPAPPPGPLPSWDDTARLVLEQYRQCLPAA